MQCRKTPPAAAWTRREGASSGGPDGGVAGSRWERARPGVSLAGCGNGGRGSGGGTEGRSEEAGPWDGSGAELVLEN